MIVCETNDITSLLESLDFPSYPCPLDGKEGFAYYSGHDIEVLRTSRAKMICCHTDMRTALDHEAPNGTRMIFSDNPLLLYSRIARQKYASLIQPQGLWKSNPDGSQPVNTMIHPGAVIYDNATIGDNCVIGANSVIGDAGFGFSRDENGNLLSVPHFGGVRIGDNVEIGPGSVIDCGTFGDTRIENNVRIDNMVQIGHNVTINSGSRIMASVSISGGVCIGNDCWIAPKAMIRNGLVIGSKVLIGCSSMVTIDIPDQHRYQPRYADLHLLESDDSWDKG